MLHEQAITGGVPLQLEPLLGRVFLLDSPGAAGSVTVTLLKNGSEMFRAPGMKRGFRIRAETGFSGIRIESAINTTVRWFIAQDDVDIDTTDGAEVSIPGGVEVTNTALNPVPVDVLGAVVTVNDFVMKSDGAVTDSTAAPGAVAAQFAALDATRRSMRVKNIGAVDVAIGGAGVVFATAAVVLQPGGVWVEDDGAGCAWFAVTAGGAGSIALQVIA